MTKLVKLAINKQGLYNLVQPFKDYCSPSKTTNLSNVFSVKPISTTNLYTQYFVNIALSFQSTIVKGITN